MKRPGTLRGNTLERKIFQQTTKDIKTHVLKWQKEKKGRSWWFDCFSFNFNPRYLWKLQSRVQTQGASFILGHRVLPMSVCTWLAQHAVYNSCCLIVMFLWIFSSGPGGHRFPLSWSLRNFAQLQLLRLPSVPVQGAKEKFKTEFSPTYDSMWYQGCCTYRPCKGFNSFKKYWWTA